MQSSVCLHPLPASGRLWRGQLWLTSTPWPRALVFVRFTARFAVVQCFVLRFLMGWVHAVRCSVSGRLQGQGSYEFWEFRGM